MVPTIFLFAWPLISLIIFAVLDFKRGLVTSTIVGYLFLPPSFSIDLPVLPPYDKRTAIAAALLLAWAVFANKASQVPRLSAATTTNRAFGRLLIFLFLLWVFSPVMVYLTNRQGLSFGPTYLPGLRPWDIISTTWAAAISFVPFFFARKYLVNEEDHRMTLNILVAVGLAYTFLVLFEARMSPQLSIWFYGYFPHDWIQHIRGGAFRPIVFLDHGLVVGLLLLTLVLACISLSRVDTLNTRMVYLLGALWVFLVLLVSRNFGALLLTVLFAPLLLFLTTGMLVRISAVVAVIFLLYPVVRQAELLPVDGFISLIQPIAPERAGSFRVRLENEQDLLARAFEKPLFGWGGFGRSRIFNEWGRDISLVDGLWIAILGTRGWVGYISFFGILTLPVIWLGLKMQRIPPVTAGITIILAANFIDLVPNSAMTPIGLLFVGALAGYVQFVKVAHADPATQTGPPEREGVRYTRFETTNRP